jgi:hypothetical protein
MTLYQAIVAWLPPSKCMQTQCLYYWLGEIKTCDFRAASSNKTTKTNFIKICPAVQVLNHRNRETWSALCVHSVHSVQAMHNNTTAVRKSVSWRYRMLCGTLGKGTYTACSSSSLPICRDTVLSDPSESLIISNCSSWVLMMWFCCWSVSSRNCLFGLSNSFSSLEYLVDPWLVGTRTGLFSRSGYGQNILEIRLTATKQTHAPVQPLYVTYFNVYKLYS